MVIVKTMIPKMIAVIKNCQNNRSRQSRAEAARGKHINQHRGKQTSKGRRCQAEASRDRKTQIEASTCRQRQRQAEAGSGRQRQAKAG